MPSRNDLGINLSTLGLKYQRRYEIQMGLAREANIISVYIRTIWNREIA